MGILEKIEAARQKAIQEDAARKLIHEAARKTALRDLEQERIRLNNIVIPTYIRDTQSVIRVVKSLPKTNYLKYLKQVKDFTRYELRIGIYISPEPKPDSLFDHPFYAEMKRLISQRNLALEVARLQPAPSHRSALEETAYDLYHDSCYSPDLVFFGDYAQDQGPFQKATDFFSLFRRKKAFEEPQLPGIGISFDKCNRTNGHPENKQAHGRVIQEFEWTETRDNIYIRISPPTDTLITNAIGQQRFQLDSLQSLDNALELAFEHPIHTVRSGLATTEPIYWEQG